MRARRAARTSNDSRASATTQEPELAPPWIIDEASKLHGSTDEFTRITAAEKLRNSCPGIAEYSPFFAGTLAFALRNDTNHVVRKAAAEAIVSLGPPAKLYIDTFEAGLVNDSDPQVRQACAKFFSSMGQADLDFSHAHALGSVALHDSESSVREEAAKALASATGPTVDAELQMAVDVLANDKNDVLRSRAAFLLGFVTSSFEKYSEALAQAALVDKSAGVRRSAASAIRCLGDSADHGLTHLVAGLEDHDPSKRKAAAMALGMIGCRDQVDLLDEAVVVDEDSPKLATKKKRKQKKGAQPSSQLQSPMSRSDLQSQSEVEPEKAKEKHKKKRTKGKPTKSPSALPQLEETPPPKETLSAIQCRASAALATTCMRDSNAFVRYRAAEAMNSFGKTMDQRLQEMANKALQDENAEARSRASEALGTLGDYRALHARTFSNLVIDSDPIIQRRAIDALRDLGTAASPHRKVLSAVMQKSSDESLRVAARRTRNFLETRPLGELGRRVVSPQKFSSKVELQNSMRDLRALVADSLVEARCSTPAAHRSESLLLCKAKLLA